MSRDNKMIGNRTNRCATDFLRTSIVILFIDSHSRRRSRFNASFQLSHTLNGLITFALHLYSHRSRETVLEWSINPRNALIRGHWAIYKSASREICLIRWNKSTKHFEKITQDLPASSNRSGLDSWNFGFRWNSFLPFRSSGRGRVEILLAHRSANQHSSNSCNLEFNFSNQRHAVKWRSFHSSFNLLPSDNSIKFFSFGVS